LLASDDSFQHNLTGFTERFMQMTMWLQSCVEMTCQGFFRYRTTTDRAQFIIHRYILSLRLQSNAERLA